MGRERNTVQMKEKIRTPEKELNKMEINNLSNEEFKALFTLFVSTVCKDAQGT